MTVVTGAFSSGKTTVINHILAHHTSRFAVIENQVGEIAVTDTSVLVWSFTEDVCTWPHGDSPCISSRGFDHHHIPHFTLFPSQCAETSYTPCTAFCTGSAPTSLAWKLS